MPYIYVLQQTHNPQDTASSTAPTMTTSQYVNLVHQQNDNNCCKRSTTSWSSIASSRPWSQYAATMKPPSPPFPLPIPSQHTTYKHMTTGAFQTMNKLDKFTRVRQFSFSARSAQLSCSTALQSRPTDRSGTAILEKSSIHSDILHEPLDPF